MSGGFKLSDNVKNIFDKINELFNKLKNNDVEKIIEEKINECIITNFDKYLHNRIGKELK